MTMDAKTSQTTSWVTMHFPLVGTPQKVYPHPIHRLPTYAYALGQAMNHWKGEAQPSVQC